MLQIIGRLIVVLIALFLAIITALTSFTAMILMLLDTPAQQVDAQAVIMMVLEQLSIFAGYLGAVGGVTLVIPALLLALIGETVQIRSWMYYLLGGGLAILVIPFIAMAGIGEPPSAAVMTPRYLAILFTTGIAMGFMYWLIAGRKA